MAASKHTTSITTGLAYSYWSVQTLDAQKTGRDWPVMSGSRKLNFWKNFEFANALMDVAAYFPFRQGTFEFELKPFLKEVQRIADERYGGKFT